MSEIVEPGPPLVRLEPRTVFLLPGDAADVTIEVANLNAGLRTIDLVLSTEQWGTDARAVPAGVTMSLSEEAVRLEGGQSASLTLSLMVAADTESGLFHPTVSAESFGMVTDADFTVAVLPAGPPALGATEDVVAIASSGYHSLALTSGGAVWAWGDNRYGQLGDGTLVSRLRPVRIADLPGRIVDIAAGETHSLVALDDGRVFSWGDNGDRQISLDARVYPLPVGTLTDLAVHAAGAHGSSLAAWADGTVVLRGSILLGFPIFPGNEPQIPGFSGTMREVVGGGEHFLALLDDGRVEGIGAASFGQLGRFPLGNMQSTPIEVRVTPDIAGIAAGADHSLLIRNDGALLLLGANGSGQLGDGTRGSRRDFVEPAFLGAVASADGGFDHSLAAETDGEVWAWGANRFGQVGTAGDATAQLVPVRVSGLPDIEAVAAGGRHSFALDRECGKLWAFGDNAVGQLGDGTASVAGERRPRPVPVFGFGEANARPGCEVALTVLSLGTGQGRISLPDGTDGEDCGARACALPVVQGDSASLSAVPEPGSEFLGWAGDCTGTQPSLTVVMDRSRNCYARFEPAPGLSAPPVAAFTTEPNPAMAGAAVVFDASPSSDDVEILSYDWDFTNDGVLDANGREVEFAYGLPGTFTARLMVTDGDALTDETTRAVTVQPVDGSRFRIRINMSPGGSADDVVISDPGGIECTRTGGACEAEFTALQVLLTALPGADGSSATWSDTCAADGLECLVVNPGDNSLVEVGIHLD